jgi:hypothetical protein
MIERGREWGGPRQRRGDWEGIGVDSTTVETVRRRGRRAVWTRWRSGRRSMRHRCGPDDGGGGVASMQAWRRSMRVSWTRRRSRRLSARCRRGPGNNRGGGRRGSAWNRQRWRRSRSGRVGGSEMILPVLGFKGRSCHLKEE